MTNSIARRVRLSFGYQERPVHNAPKEGWPSIIGQLQTSLRGATGKVEYLMRVDPPLPADFDPIGRLLPEFKREVHEYLLLGPLQQGPGGLTIEDPIGYYLGLREIQVVAVALAKPPEVMPKILSASTPEFPSLGDAYLEPYD